jgi:hypothetical protein
MTIDKDYIINDLNSTSTFYDWFIKENTEIIEKLNMLKVFDIQGVNGITAPVATNGVASIGLSGKVDDGISFNGPAYFNGFAAIPNIAVKVPQINSTVGGFTFGTPVRVYYDTDTSTVKYEGARANDQDQAEVMGVVSEITPSYGYVTLLGKIDGDFSAVNTRGIGLTAGWVYFLDPGITGNITDIEPILVGQTSKPVIMGLTGNSGLVLQMRGSYNAGISGNNYATFATLTSNASFNGNDPEVSLFTNKIISVITISSTQNAAFLAEADQRSILRLTNSNTSQRTYAYASTVNDPDSVFFNTAENDILGLVVDIKLLSGKIVLTVLTNGFTEATAYLPENGIYYLNPDYPGYDGFFEQYNTNYCSSGILLFNKFDNFSIFYNYRVPPCTSNRSTSLSSSSSSSTESINYLINGNYNIWQRNTGKNTAYTSTGNIQFADMWRRHDGITGGDSTKNYYIIRREFDEYQTEIEGNPQYYVDIKALGASALGLSGTSGGYTAYDHLMVGHVIPGAKKFDSTDLNVSFYGKISSGVSGGYPIDVYLSRYSNTNLLDYKKLGIAYLSTTWTKYDFSSFIDPLENTGIPLTIGQDYSEIGIDFIPLIERANLNGIPLGQDVYVSIASFAASTNGYAATVYPEYSEQLEYCQKFYLSTYGKDQLIGSITMTDVLTPSQNTPSIFILPNKSCVFYKWPKEMRNTPTISVYSPMSGISSRAYNKTASSTSVQLDTINTSGVGGRNGSGATITATPSIYGTDICINNGIINYDDVYFHIIADADFPI